MKEREKFGSRLGFILVSAGCAIGLGNVWKFPYICGQNGGAAFILIYLVFLVVLGLPILVCEFAVGRGSRRGIARCYEELEKPQSKWHRFKWMDIIGNYLLMMFYTMVGGWMLYYAYKMGTGQLSGLNTDGVTAQFGSMMGSPKTMILWMLIALVISFGVCALGLNNGVEKVTKVMMTLLIILMVILAIRSVTLKNATEGLKFYLMPDFSKMKANGFGTVVFAAMSHSFFTLGIGIGSMEIFGSYLKKDRALVGESINIIILDTLVALVAGIIIIPACFAYGVQPDSGPPLLFMTLPNVFNHMAGGRIWGTLFFVFMSFAAISTIIAVFENLVSFYMDLKGWSRKKSVIVNMVAMSVLSLPAILGYNVLSNIHPLGGDSTLMDFEDFLVSYNILPFGCIVFVLFCIKKNAWGWDNFINEINEGKGLKVKGKKALKIYMTYILPAIIVAVYLKGYYDYFAPKGKTALICWMSFAVILMIAVFAIILKKPKKVKE